MARKIRFGLELKDGYKASDSIEEIREHFDYAKLVEYFLNGKLKQWLEDRHYESEAIELSALKPDASDFKERLCYIFKVDSKSSAVDKMIVDDMAKIKKRDLVRQYTSDEKVLNNIDSVATTQKELEKLCKQKSKVIYLCGRNFSISPEYESVKYVGLGNITVKVDSKEKVDFRNKKIVLENIDFDADYIALLHTPMKQTMEIENSEKIIKRYMQRNGIEEYNIEEKQISKKQLVTEIFAKMMNRDVELLDMFTFKDFTDIDNVIVRKTGRIDIYTKNGDVIYLRADRLKRFGLNPDIFRLFVLVMGVLYSNMKYTFIHEEERLLDGIFLNGCYQGSIMSLINDLNRQKH